MHESGCIAQRRTGCAEGDGAGARVDHLGDVTRVVGDGRGLAVEVAHRRELPGGVVGDVIGNQVGRHEKRDRY